MWFECLLFGTICSALLLLDRYHSIREHGVLSVMNRKMNTQCLHCCEKEEEVDDLRSWLLLLLLPQSGKTNTGNLDDLEANTWDISLGLALASETGKQDLVVLVDEVQATIVWNWKRC